MFRIFFFKDSKNDIIPTLVDLAKDNDTGELRLRVVRNRRMEDEDAYLCDQNAALKSLRIVKCCGHTHIAAMLCRHIYVGLLDEHCDQRAFKLCFLNCIKRSSQQRRLMSR